MSRRLRWWLWAVGAACLLLVAIGIGSWVVMRAYGPALTRERIERGLAEALGRPARVERVDLQPWLARLVVRGVAVAAGPTWEAGTAVEIGRVTVGVGISSLWRREIVLSRIALQDVDVRYTADGGGEPLTFPATIPDRIALGPVTAVIGEVALDRARVLYADPRAGRSAELHGLTARARAVDGGVDATVAAASVAARAAGLRETLTDVTLAGRLRGDRVTVLRFLATWRGEEIRASGEARDLATAPAVALDVGGKVPLAPLAELAGAGVAVTGVAAFEGGVKGPLVAPAAAAKVSVPELAAAGAVARRVSADLAWSDGTLRVSDVRAQALEGQLRGGLVLTPARPQDGQLTFTAERVSLAALEPLVGRSLGARGRMSADGELRGDLRRPLEAEGKVQLRSSDLTLPEQLARLGAGTVEAEVRVGGGAAEVLRGAGRWAGLRVGDVGGRLRPEGPASLRALLAADAGRLARLWGEDRVSGEATVAAELDGRWSDLVATGRARAGSLGVAGVGLSGVDVPFRYASRALTFTDATAGLGQSRVAASGTLRWTGPDPVDVARAREHLRLQADVATTGAHLQDFDRWIPADWRGTGQFSLTGRLEGTIASWRGTGSVSASALRVRGEPVEDLSARFDVSGAGLEVSGARGRVGGIPVEGEGAWMRDGDARVSGRLGPAPLARVPRVPASVDLRGTARVHLDVRRTNGSVSGTAALTAEGASAFGVELGRGTLDARVADDVLTATAAFPGARLSARAHGRLASGQEVAVVVTFADLSLEPLLARVTVPAGAEVRGQVSGSADLAVPFSSPVAMRGRVRLDPVVLVLNDDEWRNRGPVVLERRAESTRLERVQLASALGALDVTGIVEDAGRLDLAGRGRFPLATLGALRPEIAQAAGVLEVDGQVAGTMRAPEVSGEGSIRDGRIVARDLPGIPVTGIRARFTGSRQRVRVVEAVGTVGDGGEVRAHGDVLFGGAAPRLDVDVAGQVPLALAAAVRPEIREASGTLTFSGKISGAATAPEVRGEGTIQDGRVVARDVATPIEGLRARFTLGPDRIRVAEAVATIEGGDVRASGDVGFGRPARLDLKIAGRLPLGPLATLRPEIREAAGFVDVTGTVAGTTAAPQAAGEGTIRDARLTLRDYPESLRDVRARFTVTPGGVRVASAAASFGGGELAVSGDLALKGRQVGSYRFDIQARRVALEPVSGFHTSWDATLELVGFDERSLLRGDARLLRGTYVSELPLLRLLLEPRRGTGGGATSPGLPLEVRVNLDDNLVVRTAVARFRAGGVVTLQGTTNAPILFGAVQTTEGQLIFRKQRFTITSASARFIDPRRVDPILDVQAEARIQTYDVTLRMSGRSENLEIRLASSPSLPEQDILSLIAFGTTREQLARGGAGAVAGEMAGLIVQDLFGLKVDEGAGPVDIFELQSTETEGRTVRVGKRLGDRATVLYSQGIENTDERRLRLEYEVVGPLVVAGEQNFRGGFGADVLVRLRFR